MEKSLRLASRLRRGEIEIELITSLGYISNYAGDWGSTEKYFKLGMNRTRGQRSEICRCNLGIAKGEG
jgi:hypothetical protein